MNLKKNTQKWCMALALITMLPLAGCLESEGNKTTGTSYGTVVADKFGKGKFVAIENSAYGVTSGILSPTVETELENLELGDRVIVDYQVDWDNQPADRDNWVEATVVVSDYWKVDNVVNNYSDEVYASDSLLTMVGPFFTYDSNGRSIITFCSEVYNIAPGGTPYTLTLERASDMITNDEGEVVSDTLNYVYNKGDISSDGKSTLMYQSFVLPDKYKDNKVELVIRISSKSYISYTNLKLEGDKDNRKAYFVLPFYNASKDDEDKND